MWPSTASVRRLRETPFALLVVSAFLVAMAGSIGALDVAGPGSETAVSRDDPGDVIPPGDVPTATRAAPQTQTFVGTGAETELTVSVTDRDGDLHRVEWYVDGRHVDTQVVDGNRTRNGLDRTFGRGEHNVTAVAYDRDWASSRPVNWTVVANGREGGTALYVWRRADDVVAEGPNRTRFFETTERYGVDAVYLSWSATRNRSDDALASFVSAAHDRNLAVHALVSARGVDRVRWVREPARDVIRYNAARDAPGTVDGIHVNAEPRARSDSVPTFVDRFHRNVTSLADATVAGESVASQDLNLSLAVAPWWTNDARGELAALLDDRALDYVTVMAYSDNAPAVEAKIAEVTALDADVDYEFAVETSDLTADGTDSPATFYEEGPEAMTRAVDAVTRDPPRPDRFRGRTIHSYSGLREWAAENRSGR